MYLLSWTTVFKLQVTADFFLKTATRLLEKIKSAKFISMKE